MFAWEILLISLLVACLSQRILLNFTKLVSRTPGLCMNIYIFTTWTIHWRPLINWGQILRWAISGPFGPLVTINMHLAEKRLENFVAIYIARWLYRWYITHTKKLTFHSLTNLNKRNPFIYIVISYGIVITQQALLHQRSTLSAFLAPPCKSLLCSSHSKPARYIHFWWWNESKQHQ